MLNAVRKLFEDWTSQYDQNEYDLSLHEWIKSLIDRIDYLEDQNVWMRSEIRRLSEENIETTNLLYEIQNKIQINNDESLQNFTLGDS